MQLFTTNELFVNDDFNMKCVFRHVFDNECTEKRELRPYSGNLNWHLSEPDRKNNRCIQSVFLDDICESFERSTTAKFRPSVVKKWMLDYRYSTIFLIYPPTLITALLHHRSWTVDR